ncbi:MAG: tetratricopeptide repeat protein [Bacteroidota bacterium]
MQRIRNWTIAAALIIVAAIGLYIVQERPSDSVPDLLMRNGEAATSVEFRNVRKSVQYYRDRIASHPDEIKNYVELAQVFIQEGRVSGLQHEYILKAQPLLDEALRRDPKNFDALVTNASMQLTLHHFAEAKAIVEEAIVINPYSAAAYGVFFDALVELGEYDQALQACDKMMSIRPDLRSYSRVSYLREIHGDLDGAREAMKLAAQSGIPGQENRAWALYTLGKLYMQQGMLDTAQHIFAGILEERPGYAHALRGQAEVASARGDHRKAIAHLVNALDLMLDHGFLEQLVDEYEAIGDRVNRDATMERVEAEFEEHGSGGWNVDREFAEFCLNHDITLPEALSRAEREYRQRPGNIDVLSTYAWALHKNDQSAEAVPLIEEAMRLKTQSTTIFFRAGLIYKATHQTEKARTMLASALTLNPHLTEPTASMAREALSTLDPLAQGNEMK